MSNLSISRRGKVWQYRVDLKGLSGSKSAVSKSGFKTKKEAHEAALLVLEEYQSKGRVYLDTKLLLSDYLDNWYKTFCILRSRFNTQRCHSNAIERHIKPCLGKYTLTDLNPYIIQDFINALKLGGVGKRNLRNIFGTLKTSLDYTVNTLKILRENPCNGVKLPVFDEPENKKRYVISLTNFQRIIEKFPPGTPEYLPLVIGFHTGMRISEVFALTWDDIDFDKGVISVNKSIVHRMYSETFCNLLGDHMKHMAPPGWFFGPTKSKAGTRMIAIGATLAKILKEEYQRQQEDQIRLQDEYLKIYRKPEKDEKGNNIDKLIPVAAAIPPIYPEARMVCRRSTGSYFPHTSLIYGIKKINDELGIPFNFHSLRHTHATMLIQGGVNIKAVQHRLGHSKIGITLDIYSHVTSKMIENSVEIFESEISKIGITN